MTNDARRNFVPAAGRTRHPPIAVILRSWEERFGASLLEVGFAEVRLLVKRTPRSHEAAQRLGASNLRSATSARWVAGWDWTNSATSPRAG